MFGSLFVFSSSVSALGTVDGISLNYNQDPNASNYIFGDNLNEKLNHAAEALYYNFPNALIGAYPASPFARWRGFSLQTNQTIPGNSIVSFSMSYKIDDSLDTKPAIFTYNGVQFEDGRTLLYDSCLGTNLNQTNVREFQCTYVFWNRYNTNLIQSKGGVHIIEPGSSLPNTSVLTVIWGGASALQLTNDGLSASDRAWLESVLPSGSVVGQVEEGVKNAMDDVEDEQQDKYEDQASENEDTISSDSTAAQNTATSLLQVIVQAIGVFSSAQPTNCNIDGSLIPHLPLGTLNLCQNSPPAAITALGSILLIGFVVPLAYHLVKRMLALIGSFQS